MFGVGGELHYHCIGFVRPLSRVKVLHLLSPSRLVDPVSWLSTDGWIDPAGVRSTRVGSTHLEKAMSWSIKVSSSHIAWVGLDIGTEERVDVSLTSKVWKINADITRAKASVQFNSWYSHLDLSREEMNMEGCKDSLEFIRSETDGFVAPVDQELDFPRQAPSRFASGNDNLKGASWFLFVYALHLNMQL